MKPVALRLVSLLVFILVGRMLAAEDLARRTWSVDGVTRDAMVHLPVTAAPGGAPIVFVFHGHGGTMKQAARTMDIHRHWPEAIVVYPQGLPTAGQLVDREGRQSGWQSTAGAGEDRDLKFFDAMYADLLGKCRFDDKRVYATGHSNGGVFTYLLWAQRGDKFAAVAPSAGVLPRGLSDLRPKPVLHVGSPDDTLVKFSWQERMIDEVLRLNGCGPRQPTAIGYTVYPSSNGAETATFLHAGGHRYSAEAPELIVRFFQAHRAP
ncbi:MAG TPA: prolyl oligopeptidase family serine peptidase [Lacunisphaera sp.]|nr:prolyl oligopeptidase family serine peptidase [Lacunisphaera sp.]